MKKNSIGIVLPAQIENVERGQGHMEELRTPARGNILEKGVVGKPGDLKQQLTHLNAWKQAAGQEMNSGKWLFILFGRKAAPAPNTWWQTLLPAGIWAIPALPGLCPVFELLLGYRGEAAGCPTSQPCVSEGE